MKIFFLVVYFKLHCIYHRHTSLKLYDSLNAVHKIVKSFYTLLITCICFKPKKESKKSIKTFLPISKLCLSQKGEHFLSSAPIRLTLFIQLFVFHSKYFQIQKKIFMQRLYMAVLYTILSMTIDEIKRFIVKCNKKQGIIFLSHYQCINSIAIMDPIN